MEGDLPPYSSGAPSFAYSAAPATGHPGTCSYPAFTSAHSIPPPIAYVGSSPTGSHSAPPPFGFSPPPHGGPSALGHQQHSGTPCSSAPAPVSARVAPTPVSPMMLMSAVQARAAAAAESQKTSPCQPSAVAPSPTTCAHAAESGGESAWEQGGEPGGEAGEKKEGEEKADYLRALSLKQPFCSAFLLRKRTQESRTWKIKLPQDNSGLWVAAHAPAKTVPLESQMFHDLRQQWPGMPTVDKLPRSAILGFLHIKEVVPLEEVPVSEREPGCNGPYVWIIDRSIPLRQPFPCSGALGMWAPPKELPVPAEVMEHCQSDVVLAMAPVPRKPSAPKPPAAANVATSGGSTAGPSAVSQQQPHAVADDHNGAAKRKRPSDAFTLGGDMAMSVDGTSASPGEPNGVRQPARRVLKVKSLGDRFYREESSLGYVPLRVRSRGYGACVRPVLQPSAWPLHVFDPVLQVRVPTPCRYDWLLSQVANKLQIRASDIVRLVQLPDLAIDDDEDVLLLGERAEIVVHLHVA
ncbi:hypothetical protein AB1Y20_016878 [Prymnesium parvum]|uniref:Ubiquitin-like domain-containing protein n=1 Tax=Prymnesium parvum TaxID=97485 RepID=A0AB34IDM5_PRYPA